MYGRGERPHPLLSFNPLARTSHTEKPGGCFPTNRKATTGLFCHKALCQMMDSNQRRQSRRIYSPLPLAARAIWHAPFGALVTLLRVAPTYANRLFRTRPDPNQTRALNARHNTPHTRARTGAPSRTIPGAPGRSPSSCAAHGSPGYPAASPAPAQRTGGSAAPPQTTSRGLRSHG